MSDETPWQEARHGECDCVPDLGPSHCHLCDKAVGHPVEWSSAPCRDNTKSHKHDIPAMSGKGDNTKSADPLPWLCATTGHRYPDEDTARHFCGYLTFEFAPRPEFGFTEGNDK